MHIVLVQHSDIRTPARPPKRPQFSPTLRRLSCLTIAFISPTSRQCHNKIHPLIPQPSAIPSLAMSLRFAGKHAAVVGATGVIGSHIAQALARSGAVVSLLGRSALTQRARLEAQLPPPAPLPSSSLPSEHQFIKLDVSDAANIKDVFAARRGGRAAAEEDAQTTTVGPVDILVNCAGISQTTFLKRTPDEELARIVDTNLLATMLVCKHAQMQPHGTSLLFSVLYNS